MGNFDNSSSYETSPEADLIYTHDSQLLDQLNDFNSEYAKYVRCNYNNKYNSINNPTGVKRDALLDDNGEPLQCSEDDLNRDKLEEKYELLREKIKELKEKIINKMPTKSPTVPEVQLLKTKQNEILRERQTYVKNS